MRTTGILHAQLALHIARLRHTDTFVVGDAGLPVPPGVPEVDLAVGFGIPRFADVLDLILSEVAIEGAVRAVEAEGRDAGRWLAERFPDAEAVPHEELKSLTASARFIVRTGEASPYANVLLRAGVPF